MEIIREALGLLVPGPAGALWIGIVVAAVVLVDPRAPFARRNLYVALLFAAAFPLVQIFQFDTSRWARVLFSLLFVATATYTVWGVVLSRRSEAIAWKPNLPRSALAGLVGLVVVMNAVVVFGRHPDDAGYYTNLGAQRWVETGVLPYGDPLLKGPDAPGYGASATYGPLLYAAHIPIQLAVGPRGNAPDADPMDRSYERPPIFVTQAACFAFFLAGLWALFALVRRYGDDTLALAAVAVFAGSPYVIGLGGTAEVITGLAFISHIAPMAMMLLAMVAITRPAVSGALLACAAGLLFWPAFVFPAWLGWYASRREAALKFTGGFAAAGLAIGLVVLLFTPASGDMSAVDLFVESTLEHQQGTGPREYGASTFGFWGQNPDLASFWQEPAFGDSSLFSPMFLIFATFALSAFVLARGRTVPQLAGLTAGLGAGVQLWKTHAAGSYVEWYLPFLLVALLCAGWSGARSRSAGLEPETDQDDLARPADREDRLITATEGGR